MRRHGRGLEGDGRLGVGVAGSDPARTSGASAFRPEEGGPTWSPESRRAWNPLWGVEWTLTDVTPQPLLEPCSRPLYCSCLAL